ncbi:sigma-70 family RNA polymerase sigma factor [Paenibacillus sp. N1-5-1-14]|uniref:RNA polymerase sigma factor n=1 Tax=Paenibacillus radicibacter TaxID=2972488 RepID=UPI002158B619|nr:sigma-70 family RNA polymerase sigma factor [Paenibacillus radicibacter]MCR8644744.1 sigma-70 family RNA polymerase sigma factor [Paenibacillus radicibacter]
MKYEMKDGAGAAMEDLTDEQLIESIRQGHVDAYRYLVDRHKGRVFTFIYQMVGQRETAEDLAQEVFIKVFRNLEHYRGDAKFTTWLYRMIMNQVIDYRRSQKRKPLQMVLDKVKDWWADDNLGPEGIAVKQEQRDTVHHLLAGLPDKYRDIMFLYHFEELSYQEIAALMNLPIKTVETRLYRGKSLLKNKWMEVEAHEQSIDSRRRNTAQECK